MAHFNTSLKKGKRRRLGSIFFDRALIIFSPDHFPFPKRSYIFVCSTCIIRYTFIIICSMCLYLFIVPFAPDHLSSVQVMECHENQNHSAAAETLDSACHWSEYSMDSTFLCTGAGLTLHLAIFKTWSHHRHKIFPPGGRILSVEEGRRSFLRRQKCIKTVFE